MIKFCYLDGTLMKCDDATIEKFNLEVVKEVTDEEYAQYGNYYVRNGEVFLGADPIELINNEISELKHNLFDTDYLAIKFGEGLISAEEYAPIKDQRQQWRGRINELEGEL